MFFSYLSPYQLFYFQYIPGYDWNEVNQIDCKEIWSTTKSYNVPPFD